MKTVKLISATLFLSILFLFSTSASAAVVINGYSTSRVDFEQGGVFKGFYQQVGNTSVWHEKNAQSKTTFTFKEQFRDQWSVYLHDGSRNAYIQLDMHTKKVNFKEGNGSYRDLYKIRRAFAVTGENASRIEFTQGAYQQVPNSKTWKEENTSGKTTFTFKELNRDAWSVYLFDASRNVYIQLDIHTKKVNFKEGCGNYREQYQIRNAFVVTGVNAAKVEMQKGAFDRTQNGTWNEMSAGKVRFTFKEQGRDAWSVYLFDASRNVYIQLDLHRSMVRYKEGNGQYRDLYSIIGAEAS